MPRKFHVSIASSACPLLFDSLCSLDGEDTILKKTTLIRRYTSTISMTRQLMTDTVPAVRSSGQGIHRSLLYNHLVGTSGMARPRFELMDRSEGRPRRPVQSHRSGTSATDIVHYV